MTTKIQSLIGLAMMFLLAGCIGGSGDQAPSQKDRLPAKKPEFFKNDVGQTPIQLHVDRTAGGNALYAEFRFPRKNQNTVPDMGELYLCHVTPDQEPQLLRTLEEVDELRGAGLFMGEAFKEFLITSTGSFVVTAPIPPYFNLAQLSDKQKSEIISNAIILSWPPGEGSQERTCTFNITSNRPSLPNQRPKITRSK